MITHFSCKHKSYSSYTYPWFARPCAYAIVFMFNIPLNQVPSLDTAGDNLIAFLPTIATRRVKYGYRDTHERSASHRITCNFSFTFCSGDAIWLSVTGWPMKYVSRSVAYVCINPGLRARLREIVLFRTYTSPFLFLPPPFPSRISTLILDFTLNCSCYASTDAAGLLLFHFFYTLRYPVFITLSFY